MPQQPLTSPTGFSRRARGLLRAVPVTAAGFASLLVFNGLQTLSLVAIPFSRRAFRAFNRWCADTWWGWCVSLAERFNGTRLVVTGEAVPKRENALVISNHQQMPDITTIMALARSKDRLGDLKFFVKKAIKWVPGVGWGMQFIDCPFIHRDWTADRDRIRKTFSKIVDQKIPLWLVSFVEGTRVTPEKLALSQAYARSKGLEALRHVLVPRSKGFVASVEGLGEHISAVYDVTIGYVDGVPTLWQYIKGSVQRIHVHVRRFPVDELPVYEKELRQWLHDRFVEKDNLLEHFYRHGVFPAGPQPAAASG